MGHHCVHGLGGFLVQFGQSLPGGGRHGVRRLDTSAHRHQQPPVEVQLVGHQLSHGLDTSEPRCQVVQLVDLTAPEGTSGPRGFRRDPVADSGDQRHEVRAEDGRVVESGVAAVAVGVQPAAAGIHHRAGPAWCAQLLDSTLPGTHSGVFHHVVDRIGEDIHTRDRCTVEGRLQTVGLFKCSVGLDDHEFGGQRPSDSVRLVSPRSVRRTESNIRTGTGRPASSSACR